VVEIIPVVAGAIQSGDKVVSGPTDRLQPGVRLTAAKP
jgi:hypothetical protein